MDTDTLFDIKWKAAHMLGWSVFDCELIRSGTKGGRPNWEIEHHDTHIRYAFTAFDKKDIFDLHKVEQ